MIQSSENCTDKINWCKKQSKGIKLIEPSQPLAEAYLRTADETLDLIKYDKLIKSSLWLATHKYYFLYFCAYSILMKLEIKSEIHDCTIALIKELEKNKIININLSKQLESSKIQRINNQYYLKNEKINANEDELNTLLLRVKRTITELNQNNITKARKIIEHN